MEIDHLAVTCADLAEGVVWVEARLGLPLEPGGRHDAFGTWNRVVSLGPDLYLEVIAPEPGTDPGRPRWFGLDRAGPPRLSHWIARAPDLSAALPESGEALALSRGDLRWTLTVPPDGALPWGGCFPSLIRWAGPHPADRLPDRGARLLSLEIGHPRAPRLRSLLSTLRDPRVTFVTADHPTLRARLSTSHGEANL